MEPGKLTVNQSPWATGSWGVYKSNQASNITTLLVGIDSRAALNTALSGTASRLPGGAQKQALVFGLQVHRSSYLLLGGGC